MEYRDWVPSLERLKTYWRVEGHTHKPITCALYRTPAGLEVRGERSADDLIFSHYVMNEVDGDSYAAAWRAALDEKGGFIDRPIEDVATV
jgi:hypothetical protein